MTGSNFDARRLVIAAGLLGCLWSFAALAAAGQAEPESVFTIRDGTIYHLHDCISLSGHVRVEVPDRKALGPRAVPCRVCRPDQPQRRPLTEPFPVADSVPPQLIAGPTADSCDSTLVVNEKGSDFEPWIRAFVTEVKRK